MTLTFHFVLLAILILIPLSSAQEAQNQEAQETQSQETQAQEGSAASLEAQRAELSARENV